MIITIADKTFDITIKEEHGNYAALIDKELVEIVPEFDKNNKICAINLNGKRYAIQLIKTKKNYQVSVFTKPLTVLTEQTAINTEHMTHDQRHVVIHSPMSGLVIHLPVKAGQQVEKESQLLVLEAMKMQNEIKSPIKAKIADIFIRTGQTVEKDDALIVLEKM